jgi:hypothetical protein
MSLPNVLLLKIVAAWGAIIDQREYRGLACVMVAQIMELRFDVGLQTDFISKFLVCSVLS